MDYPITKQEYDHIRTLLYDESGISLGENKQSLVVSRLSKRLRDLQLDNFDAYYEFVTSDESGADRKQREALDEHRPPAGAIRVFGQQRCTDHIEKHVDAEHPGQVAPRDVERGTNGRKRGTDDGDIESAHEHAAEQHAKDCTLRAHQFSAP